MASGPLGSYQMDDLLPGRLDHPTVTALPLNVRNVISLVTLGPGAVPRHLGGFTHDVINDIQEGSRGAVAVNPPINGARSTMNAFLLDGAYNTDRHTFALAVNPPLEAVQEFRIQTSLAAAEFAQAGGGVADVVTRAGSRNFHGSAAEFFRNEGLDAHWGVPGPYPDFKPFFGRILTTGEPRRIQLGLRFDF